MATGTVPALVKSSIISGVALTSKEIASKRAADNGMQAYDTRNGRRETHVAFHATTTTTTITIPRRNNSQNPNTIRPREKKLNTGTLLGCPHAGGDVYKYEMDGHTPPRVHLLPMFVLKVINVTSIPSDVERKVLPAKVPVHLVAPRTGMLDTEVRDRDISQNN
ncbi:hypothetical protein CPB85DRAFT_1256536 [Mucidula mucida]|nr:hypothetical protein CPB85DRAFT_1256536 [Mucidula mucida]